MKKVRKDVGHLVGANIGIGIGSAIVGGAGGNVAGLRTMGSMMPIVSIGVLGKHTLRLTKRLIHKK